MKPYTALQDIKPHPTYKTKRGCFSNVIYTFDIETTSLFNYDGKWGVFDYSKPTDYYQDKDKAGVMYIWMFGIEKEVYYGRTWPEFIETLKTISNPNITKIIYVHNLSFEFGFLINIFESQKWTVSNMLARKAHKPISFMVDELNIQFRCSYCLTNLSLEESAKKYTNETKATGDLDYNVIRGYQTELTETEMEYCRRDITSLYAVIKHFRKEYENVERIPYTQTGEVRRAFSEFASHAYQKKVKSLHETLTNYTYLMSAFFGGLTHANRLYAGKIFDSVGSFDISSSYPFALCRRYPMSTFRKVKVENRSRYSHENFAILYTLDFHNIECKYFNAYIPAYKVIGGKGIRADSGRVFKAERLQIILTDVDFDIVQRAYTFSQLNIIEMRVAVKDYLPKEFLLFMLDLYGKKTTLKGVSGQENLYMKSKQMLNSLYGACCFNVVKAGATYANGEWTTPDMSNRKYMEDKIKEIHNAYTHLFTYSWGVWCTAYARERLYNGLITASHETDMDTIYYDTDSDKLKNYKKYLPLIESLNKQADDILMNMCKARSINFDKTRPKDIKGVSHPLGHFEIDGIYNRFITLRSKCYAYEDDTGLHATISGVNKKRGVLALDGKLENFSNGLFINYENAKKMIVNYNNEQGEIVFTDYQHNQHRYVDNFGICLQPTTYSLGISEEYENLLRWTQENLHKVKRGGQNGI